MVRSVAFSPDGTTLATGLRNESDTDGTVVLWDMATKTKTATFVWSTDRIYSVAFSPGGTTLAAGLGNAASGPDHATVKLWNVGTETNIVTLSGHREWVSSVAFSPDGILASGSGDATIKLWEVATGINTATFDVNYKVGPVAFSPDGTILAFGLLDGTVRLWDVATGTNLITLFAHTSVASVAFSPDGTILASGSFGNETVQLWDVSEWTRPRSQTKPLATHLPDRPQLQQNAPNPFNSQTVLSYFLHAPGPARLEVFALTGQRVAVLRQGPQQAGYHRLRWDGRDDAGRHLASGMYLYRLATDEAVLTRKLILLR